MAFRDWLGSADDRDNEEQQRRQQQQTQQARIDAERTHQRSDELALEQHRNRDSYYDDRDDRIVDTYYRDRDRGYDPY